MLFVVFCVPICLVLCFRLICVVGVVGVTRQVRFTWQVLVDLVGVSVVFSELIRCF